MSLIEFLTNPYVLGFIKALVVFVAMMSMVPVLIYMERKIVADVQVRLGPNRLGPLGVLQPIADAVKLMMKEDILPSGVDKFIYYMAPFLAIVLALCAAAVIPFGPAPWAVVVDLNHSLLYSLAISSMSVYAIALAGWASNNKYSLMGALRAAAQMISYELGMGLSLIALVMVTGTLSISEIVAQQNVMGWNIYRAPTLFIAFIVFAICGVAETNRSPFDLAEAETELTAGFHTEYSAFKFAIFFMAEYVNMLIISALVAGLFLGGWSGPGVHYDLVTHTVAGGWPFVILGIFWYLVKIAGFIFFYFWLRASLPRFRYDQLMNFGWKVLVPVGLANIFLVGIFFAFKNHWF
ncbi:MAG: NADH-quinone oxidoreductase subunit NuoH [Abditibacteriaceae bacterium]